MDIGQFTLGMSLSLKNNHPHNSFKDTPPCGDIPTILIFPTMYVWTCIHPHNVALVNPDGQNIRERERETQGMNILPARVRKLENEVFTEKIAVADSNALKQLKEMISWKYLGIFGA